MVATLTTGAPTDLLTQLSATPTARGGYYSPYIGAVVDVVRILSTTHTAQYQYIPALALPRKDDLNLRLNNPPSFRNPKSVLVIALPPVHAVVPPPLRAVDATQVFCANKPDLVLPAEGAPLVFATELAHNFVLHVETKPGTAIDLPAHPDPARGGFVIETRAMDAKSLDDDATGVLRGSWGFRSFEGPRFKLRTSRSSQWVLASKDASALIVGREDMLHVESLDACCVSAVLVESADGKTVPVEWKAAKGDELELKVPLQNVTAGALKMQVKKFGLREPDQVSLHAYAEAARLDTLIIHAGDIDGVLRGTRLDEVSKVELNKVIFVPGNLARDNQQDELKLVTHDAAGAAALKAGDSVPAHVALKDGRTLDLSAAIASPRPQLKLLSKNVQNIANSGVQQVIQLGNANELPQDGRLSFFLKTQVPENYPATEKVEVATSDESFHALLSEKEGNLTPQDSKTVFATLEPMKLLGPSAFGPLKFRPVSDDGADGDWQPLASLVRMPDLKEVKCTPASEKGEGHSTPLKKEEKSEPVQTKLKSEKELSSEKQLVPEKSAENTAGEKAAESPKPVASETKPAESKMDQRCTLTGDKLFLIDSVSADPDFASSITVPDGFVEASLAIPAPKGKTLYLKLRDDPSIVDTAVLPVTEEQR
jgi:hypothetical protein